MRLDVEEAELEHGEQADRACADDHGIGLDGRRAGPVHGACARCTFSWHGQVCLSARKGVRPLAIDLGAGLQQLAQGSGPQLTASCRSPA